MQRQWWRRPLPARMLLVSRAACRQRWVVHGDAGLLRGELQGAFLARESLLLVLPGGWSNNLFLTVDTLTVLSIVCYVVLSP